MRSTTLTWQLSRGDLQRQVKVNGRDATIDDLYLRIIIHDNEHMARWSHTLA
jgi:hypothetical protein